LNESFGINPTVDTAIVSSDEIIPAKSSLNKYLKELKNDGYTIALDITPGRKALVAAALMSTRKLGINHVFYLAVDSIEDIPLLMKPGTIIHLHDYLHENVTEIG
jgi:hypothetical protein